MPPLRTIRFYNAGDRIQTTIRYSNPAGHDIHVIAAYHLDAPPANFFTVPEESELEGGTIRHTFDRDIMRDWGPRGVVMIDANYEPKQDVEQDDVFPIAKDEKSAIDKGKRKWKAFVSDRVKEFLDQCAQVKSVGGVPRGADSTMQRYLKIMGMVDPSEAMLREAQKQTTAVEQLNDRLDRLERENKELREEKELELATAPGNKTKGKSA